MRKLGRAQPRYGYRRIWALLREEGWLVNRKRVQRIWREGGHVAALDDLGGLAPPAVQAGSDVSGPRCGALDGLHVGLMVIADDRSRNQR
jgi:transposase InsO family protein